MSRELDAEDAKLVHLARAARARAGSTEGAAVRDGDGRTYAGVPVELASLQLTALQVAVAAAASSGARRLEAAALVVDEVLALPGLAAVRDLGGPGVPVHVAGSDGAVQRTVRT